jgi:hypothetical protein
MCPFADNDDALISDRKLMRYLLLSLPSMQKIVDNLVNSLLFKFQGNLFFLHNCYRDIILIFKQKEYTAKEAYKQTMRNGSVREETDSNTSLDDDNFDDFVAGDCCFEVRANILRIKQIGFSYLCKILKIFDAVSSSEPRISGPGSSSAIHRSGIP